MPITHLCKLMIIGAAAMIFSSCSKSNTQGNLIPKEAAIVIRIDGKSLSSKLPWDEIKKNPLFLEINGDTGLPAPIKKLLDNPENAGIETKTDLLFFVLKDSIGGYIGFEGKVKDEGVFSTFNKEMADNGAESEKDGVQYISKSPFCVGWTKDQFVYVFDAPKMSQQEYLSKKSNRDSTDKSPRTARDIGATCKAVFAIKGSNSLAKNEKFTRLMKEKGDIQFWMNAEELSKSSASASPWSMVNLDKWYKGNITVASMNFDNGSILINTKTYAGEEMMNLFKKYSGGKINEDMIRRMPGKDLIGVMALNFKPEAIRELIKMTGLDGLVNIGIEKLGFSMDDFIKANKGDLLIGVSELVLKPDTASHPFNDQDVQLTVNQKTSFKFIFTASIGDKESFNKLINVGKKFGRAQFGDSSKMPMSFNSNGSYFVLSNNKPYVDQYLGTSRTDFDFIPKISGEPVGGYLDIQMLLKSFENVVPKDSSAKIAYDASLKIWDHIFWKGGNYSDGAILQRVEINLVDKTTNSLKQLNQYTAKLSPIYKEKRRKQKEGLMVFHDFQTGDDSRVSSPVKTK